MKVWSQAIVSAAFLAGAAAAQDLETCAYEARNAAGKSFTYTVIETSLRNHPWTAEKERMVAETERALMIGDPDASWDDGAVVHQGDAWTNPESLHDFNCHTYTFRDLVEIHPWEWLEGFSSDDFANPLLPILEHLCDPITIGLPIDAHGVGAVERALAARDPADARKWIFTLGFYPLSSNLPAERREQEWFRHSGELFLKDEHVFARSKIGSGHVVDAALGGVLGLYAHIHGVQKIPDALGLSVYACRAAVRGN